MKIGVLGLGYVGIQLSVAFGRKYETIGFDLDEEKLNAYRFGVDHSGEVTESQFKEAKYGDRSRQMGKRLLRNQRGQMMSRK